MIDFSIGASPAAFQTGATGTLPTGELQLEPGSRTKTHWQESSNAALAS